MGWVERGGEVYFFATVLEADSPPASFGPARPSITRRVLQALGVLDSAGPS